MEVTNVSCMIKDGEQHRRAVATVTLDHQFMIHDIRVVETRRQVVCGHAEQKNKQRIQGYRTPYYAGSKDDD